MANQTVTASYIYNQLPSVEKAHLLITENSKFEATLNKIGRLLFRNKLHTTVGISLLHRHNDLKANQVMVQHTEHLKNGEIALVTAREQIASIDEMLFPVIWRCLSNGEIEPLEYGLISDLKLPMDFLAAHKNVFAEVATLITENDCQLPIGLTLLDQQFLAASREGFIAIEHIDIKRAANIATLTKRSENSSAITTYWNYDGTSVQQCHPFKQCVARSPGHDVTPGHEFVDE